MSNDPIHHAFLAFVVTILDRYNLTTGPLANLLGNALFQLTGKYLI